MPVSPPRVQPLPPIVHRLRERPRLSALLDRALDDWTKLTLVSAPPGYGKTSAVAGWLASRGLNSAWLSLAPAHDDVARFARDFLAALRSARPVAVAGVDTLFGPAANPGADAVALAVLEEIATDDQPLVIVLDDVHSIISPAVHGLVRILVERAPPFVHLVLITREDPPLPLGRLRAHGHLVEVRARDLRYATDEGVDYLADRGLILDPEAVGRLVERTEGWAAGLQLAAISLRDRPDPVAAVESFTGSQRFVLDYLAEEVLDELDPELREFLVRTSIAERFTADLCAELSGRDDAERLLRTAEQANLFVVPLNDSATWYRYHRLFADYLRTHLDATQRRELHERAAGWFERSGMRAEAIEHSLAAGALDVAVRLVEREAREAFDAGELTTLQRWLDALPLESVSASSELASLRAWQLFETGQMAAARDIAERYLADRRDDVGAGRMLVLLALIDTTLGPDAERLAIEAVPLLGDDPLFRALAFEAVGLARLARGDFDAALATLRDSFTEAVRSGHPMAVLPAVNPLGHALEATGRRDEAEALARDVLRQYAGPGGRPPAIAWSTRMMLGIARYEANDVAEARRELEAGFAAARELGIGAPMLGWAIPYLALARQAAGSPEAAIQALHAGLDDARTTGVSLPSLARETEARIRLLQGSVAAAAACLSGLVPEAPPESPLFGLLSLSLDLTTARVRLAEGRLGEAASLLATVRAAHAEAADVAELISVGVLDARAAEAAGDRPAAVRALGEAVTLAAPGGYVRRFVDDAVDATDAGPGIIRLLPHVRANAPGFVDAIVNAMQPVTGTGPEAGEHRRGGSAVWQADDGQLVEALTSREQDVLGLIATGATNAEIAERLGMSAGTAKWHVGHVLAKLGVTRRAEAILRAQRLGLV